MYFVRASYQRQGAAQKHFQLKNMRHGTIKSKQAKHKKHKKRLKKAQSLRELYIIKQHRGKYLVLLRACIKTK